jgi:hypothetical protein
MNLYTKQNILSIALITSTLVFFWSFMFHWTGVHQVGIVRNIISGNIYIDTVPGPNITMPWVQVVRIDTRPHRICVECACTNMTCTLVSFRKEGWKNLIEKEGFRYYWWDNRFSFNMGHRKEYRGINDLFKGYALDGRTHNFLNYHQEINYN